MRLWCCPVSSKLAFIGGGLAWVRFRSARLWRLWQVSLAGERLRARAAEGGGQDSSRGVWQARRPPAIQARLPDTATQTPGQPARKDHPQQSRRAPLRSTEGRLNLAKAYDLFMHIVLETERLTLRRFTEDDVGNLFELNSDPEVMRYINGGEPTPREVIRDEIIPFHLAIYEKFPQLGTWAAQARSDGEFLGWFHFRPGPGEDPTNVDLGYRLRRVAWNNGYATEGSRALIRYGFTDLGVNRVFGHAMVTNSASRRVLQKCGLVMVRVIPLEGVAPFEGSDQGQVEYELTKTDWERAVSES
jgi:RimJ/RimL family protein N-acetyltransferase